jgi:hypothetical protein
MIVIHGLFTACPQTSARNLRNIPIASPVIGRSLIVTGRGGLSPVYSRGFGLVQRA